MYYFLSILVDSARKARAVFLATTSAIQIINNSWGVVMHIRKYLSIFLIGLVFAIAGCSSDSTSGISEEDRLPDTDNDGIVDKNDHDIDGDGTLNKDDTDDDGDGTPDATDPTPNGPGGEAPTPDLACTSAKVKPPKVGFTGVLNTVSWELLPDGCGPSSNPKVVIGAEHGDVSTKSDPASLGELTTNITLPQDCSWEGDVLITYDFSEIGTALGDSASRYIRRAKALVGPCDWPNDTIAKKNIARSLESSCSPTNDGDVMCIATEASQCSGSTCFQLWANNHSTVLPLSSFQKPSWHVTGVGSLKMTLYLTKGTACKAAVDSVGGGSTKAGLFYYYTGPGDNNWDTLARAGCTVRITLNDNLGTEGNYPGAPSPSWIHRPRPGNFVLDIPSGVDNQITIKSFSAGETN